MTQPKVLILRAPGTNCDLETAYAFEQAGGVAERVHINQLLESPSLLGEFQILAFPGGFSYGDDIAAGKILALEIGHRLADLLHTFKDQNKLILGICNGFQILIKSGLLLNDLADGRPAATLTWNDHGRYEDRWVHLRHNESRSFFLKGVEKLYLPIAHAEGKFVPTSQDVLQELNANRQIALRYGAPDSEKEEELGWEPVVTFPENPNGSIGDISAISDETGRVLGMMPHPERHIFPYHHPSWTRRTQQPKHGDGFILFQNAINYFQ
ncbi:MAG: phosphoribosylformylglycinamidine synthase subunit PurQ [Pirellulaceae bacterium]|nr:phosphoribosylformylglycinamidine synthase subunit PurQ [Pirellulaceae bacterium]